MPHGHRAGVDGDASRAADADDAGFERAAARPLGAVADPDAEIAAARSISTLALGKAGIVDRVEGGALVAREIAAIERDRRAGAGLERKHIRHLFRRHEIAPANLGAIELKLVGDAVEQAFHREGAFRIAGAAHRHGGDLVGLDDTHVELKGRQHVGSGQRRRRVVGKVDALRRVGAFVVDQLAAHGEQAAVVVEGDLEVPILVTLLDSGEKVLAAVFDPLDRPSQQQARCRKRHLFGIHHEFGAEAAADVRRYDAKLVFVEAQHLHQKGAYLVGELRRRPQGKPIVVDVVGGDRAAPLDRVRAAAMLLEIDAGAMGCARECVGSVAIGLLELDQEIAGACAMGARRLRCERLPAVRDRRQRRVVDRNEGRGVLGDVARLRDHDRDGLPDKGHFVLGKNERGNIAREPRRAELQRQPLLREQRREIRKREHRVHAGVLPRGGGIDGADRGVGVRAAHECRLEHVGEGEIGDEAAVAREQRAVFKPLDGAADVFRFVHALPLRIVLTTPLTPATAAITAPPSSVVPWPTAVPWARAETGRRACRDSL